MIKEFIKDTIKFYYISYRKNKIIKKEVKLNKLKKEFQNYKSETVKYIEDTLELCDKYRRE